ncbi:MAG: hypothetical protein OXT70_01165 [Chloroflexota bacterium]|nr:hypothetical protein [Chloroflexota bacterium]
MGWTNNRFGIARETSYGTAVTAGVKGYAATTEQFDPEMVENSVPGFRAGRQGLAESEHSLVLVGGTGSITVPVPVDENDLLFDGLLGTHTDFAGNAWAEATDASGPDEGRTLYMVRGLGLSGSDVERTQYSGAIPTGWSLSVTADGLAELTVNYWWKARKTAGLSSVAVSAPDAVRPYRWSDATAQLAGADIAGVTGFTIDCDLGMDTSLSYLDGQAGRAKPQRTSIPTYTGTIEMVYNSQAQGMFADWLSGTTRRLALILTAADYEAANNVASSIAFTFAAAKFTGSNPVATPESYTTISLPFMGMQPAAGNLLAIAARAKTAA